MWGIDASGWVVLLGTVATLVILEGLLSADNALVLAVMVKHLPESPKNQQIRALRYGMVGAFFFRLVAVVFASALLQHWYLKTLGGVYLLYIALSNLLSGGGDDEEGERKSRLGSGFWATVIGVELTDIAFSIDSILAAVAAAESIPRELANIKLFSLPFVGIVNVKLVVIYIGGVLGIIAMRFVAGYFLILLKKFQGLEVGAYYLVGWIGVKLVGSGFHDAIHNPEGWHKSLPAWATQLPLEMNSFLFWGGMGTIIVISLFVKPKDSHEPPTPPGELVETTQTHE